MRLTAQLCLLTLLNIGICAHGQVNSSKIEKRDASLKPLRKKLFSLRNARKQPWRLYGTLIRVEGVAINFSFKQTRIVGGQEAEKHRYKSILRMERFGCAATLISVNWAITAAHCLASPLVRVGSYLIAGDHYKNNDTTNGRQKVKILRTIKHESYESPVPHAYDIALLEIETVKLTDVVDLAEFPDDNYEPIPGNWATVVGWGKLKEGGQGAQALQEVELPLITINECIDIMEEKGYKVHRFSTICTLYPDGGKDGCQGDSGGPLYAHEEKNGRNILIGVVSWGVGCARPEFPAFFVHVPHLLPWIRKHMGVAGDRSESVSEYEPGEGYYYY